MGDIQPVSTNASLWLIPCPPRDISFSWSDIHNKISIDHLRCGTRIITKLLDHLFSDRDRVIYYQNIA